MRIARNMDYRTLFIQLAAMLLLYVLLHKDNMDILNACMTRKAECSQARASDDDLTEDERVIADAIFGSMAAPLFSAKVGGERFKPQKSARVEEVPEQPADQKGNNTGLTVNPPADSPNASQTTAGSTVRRRTPKKTASIDVPSA